MNSWLQRLAQSEFDGLYIVGEDLATLFANEADIVNAMKRVPFLVVQDTCLSATAKLAHVVLPATHFAEKDGTYTNRKGRVQRLRPALIAPPPALQDWEIFSRLLSQAGEKTSYRDPREIFHEITRQIPVYKNLSYEKIGELGMQLES
jgi:predicted molibdopterin-dependent oxidoreductase YjgC